MKKPGLLVGVALALLAPSVALADEPPALNTYRATKATQKAIDASTGGRATRIKCRRLSRLKWSCTARWGSTPRYSASSTITRSGPAISPIDRYRLRVTTRWSYLPTERKLYVGRIAVETRRAKLGQMLRVAGYFEDSEVTLSLVDPWLEPEQYLQPDPGSRYVAVQATVTNVGQKRSTPSSVKIVTAAGTTLDSAYVTNCDSPTDMAPGETRVGCYAFKVPPGAVIQQVEYSAGAETGVWRP